MHVTIDGEIFARPTTAGTDEQWRAPGDIRLADDGDASPDEKESEDSGFDDDEDSGFVVEPGIAPDDFDDFDEEDFDDDFDDDFEEELEDDSLDDDVDDLDNDDGDDFDDHKIGLSRMVRVTGDEDADDNGARSEDEEDAEETES